MPELQPPPMPQKPVLIAIILIMLGMLGIIILLATVTIEKYEGEQPQTSAKTSDQPKQKLTAEEDKVDNIEEDVRNQHYREQLVNRTEGSIDEAEYLKQREKGFWYVVFPLILVIIGFVIWVYKKHKDWIN